MLKKLWELDQRTRNLPSPAYAALVAALVFLIAVAWTALSDDRVDWALAVLAAVLTFFGAWWGHRRSLEKHPPPGSDR